MKIMYDYLSISANKENGKLTGDTNAIILAQQK